MRARGGDSRKVGALCRTRRLEGPSGKRSLPGKVPLGEPDLLGALHVVEMAKPVLPECRYVEHWGAKTL
jgi:hypothetical protein